MKVERPLKVVFFKSHRSARTLFAVVDEEIVLLHGFLKKQQRTPQDELELAKKRKKQYPLNL